MSVHPCGTPAGMMMTSPAFTTLLTTSAPAIIPLHDGPFSTFVTSLSGRDLLPFTMWPPVIMVPPPDTMTYPSVWESCVRPPAAGPVGGVLVCSPHGGADAAAPLPPGAAPPPPGAAPRPAAAALPAPAVAPPVGPRWMIPTAKFS